jgi:hypothetical protein
MRKSTLLALAFVSGIIALAPGCGGGDEETPCDKAWKTWCACPMVNCDGHPESCTGPDLEWAKCVNAASDACSSNCTP